MTTIERGFVEPRGSVQELRLHWQPQREQAIERRRAAALALDPMVRGALATLLPPFPPATIDLTLYDDIYPANPHAGAHWTSAALTLGLFAHAVASYSVTLVFDDEDRPAYFLVEGARSIASVDASEAALREALERVRAAGPLSTVSTHVFPSLGL